MDYRANESEHGKDIEPAIQINEKALFDGKQAQEQNQEKGDGKGLFPAAAGGEIVEQVLELHSVGVCGQHLVNFFFTLVFPEQGFDLVF